MGSSGGGLRLGLPNIPFQLGGGVKNANLAIEMRAVDTVTGRILFATRMEGRAADYDVGVGTRIGSERTVMPIGLITYNNTPHGKGDQGLHRRCRGCPLLQNPGPVLSS